MFRLSRKTACSLIMIGGSFSMAVICCMLIVFGPWWAVLLAVPCILLINAAGRLQGLERGFALCAEELAKGLKEKARQEGLDVDFSIEDKGTHYAIRGVVRSEE